VTPRRLALHGAVVVGVALAARTIAYALAPSPTAQQLGGKLGGPDVVIVAAVALGLASLACALLIGLAAVAIGERARLAHVADAAPLRARSIPLRAAGLFAGSAALFAAAESLIHWSAGYGFHPQHCLAGPVHENAIPILAAIAVVASVAIAVGDRLVAWARRTLRDAVVLRAGAVRFTTPAAVVLGWLPVVAATPRSTPSRGPPIPC
jgi:hypothetical protein